MEIQVIGVVGAGTMGNGIAQVCASNGFPVVMLDVNKDVLERGMAAIAGSLARVVKKGNMSQEAADAALARITPATDYSAMAPVDLAIEAAPERLEIKRSVFGSLREVCGTAAIFASNTSSISITKLAAPTGRPDRFIGMHFMNPVPVMKLVEVIRGVDTSDRTATAVTDLSKKLGKIPVECNDYPGFVSNRILMPMINEAVYCLMEGVATKEAIDEIMKLGMAHPMGPLTLADLIGLDTCLSIMEVLHSELGDSKYRPCPLLRKMVDAGHLGRKTSRGFYRYEG